MASNYLSLDEAAKVLGLPADRLVEMRSQGEIRGFRDGASWKFPQDEIDRLLSESGINVLSDDEGMPGGSSILVTEQQVGSAIREGGSKIIGGDSSKEEAKSGIDAAGSDVELVARQGGGSDVQVVASRSGAEEKREPLVVDDDEELRIAPEEESGLLDLAAIEPKEGSTGPVIGAEDLLSAEAGGTGPSSDLDLQLRDSSADVLGDMDLVGQEKGGTDPVIRGDSDPDLGLGGIDDALSEDDDLVIADEDDDDLILSGVGSDISIAGDSGINLMSPSDSGLSLESEPLDLAGSSISALDLGGDAGVSPSSGGSGSGSLVDFQSDEEFQLSPSGVGLEAEEDSGSQVIEVEDSAAFVGDMDLGDDAFGGGSVVAGEGLLDDGAVMADEGLVDEGFVDEGFVDEGMGLQSGEPVAVGGAVPVAYETPFSVWSVVALAGILLLMSVGGMLMTDLVRNLWTYSEPSAPVSSLTDALISMAGLE